jgi:hypothetical protein
LVAVIAPRQVRGEDAEVLAGACQTSMYEARNRLRSLAGGPGIVATLGTSERAEAVVATLGRHGLRAWTIAFPHDEPRRSVVSYVLRAHSLVATCRAEGELEIPLEGIIRLLHGRRFGRSEHPIPPNLDPPVGFGAALADGLFGASERDGYRRVRETATSFLYAHAPGWPALVFDENELRFAAGGALVEPTRTANFARMVEQLRRLCVAATYDDRLLSRGGQLRVLGAMLRPERHLDAAIAVLVQASSRPSPYR